MTYLVIIGMVLASYLPTQEWQWNIVPEATSYRLYWHTNPNCYVATEYVEAQAQLICGEPNCYIDKCCFEPGEPLDSKYLTITAVSSNGVESIDPRRQSTCP